MHHPGSGSRHIVLLGCIDTADLHGSCPAHQGELGRDQLPDRQDGRHVCLFIHDRHGRYLDGCDHGSGAHRHCGHGHGPGTVYGLSAGTVTLAASILTYTITAPAPVAAGIPIYVAFTGIINTTTAGTYTSVVTTNTAGGVLDAATTASVTFGPSSTSVNVTVVQTLTFTDNTSSFTLFVDPSMLNSARSQAVVLTVQSNAASGYSLAAWDTGLSRTLPPFTIPGVTTGPTLGAATFPASGFGASATLTTGGTDGAALAAGFAGGDFVGYPVSAANFLTATGPTGGTPDTLTITDGVGIDLHSSRWQLL